jgi:CRP-like cAMP-binding protein
MWPGVKIFVMREAMGDDWLGQLASVDLFDGLSDEDIRIAAKSVRERAYQRGQTILTLDEAGTDVFMVLEGKVRVTIFSETGREVAFRDLSPGASFGEIAAIDSGTRSANVIALSDCVLGCVSSGAFMQLIYNHPAIAEATLKKLTKLVRALSDRVYLFSEPVDIRVCNELIHMSADFMISDNIARFVPAPKHADIASRVNTHREAVSRLMSRLTKAGLLRRGTGELIVTDLKGLRRFMHDELIKRADS